VEGYEQTNECGQRGRFPDYTTNWKRIKLATGGFIASYPSQASALERFNASAPPSNSEQR
jgi:hypothetical protein